MIIYPIIVGILGWAAILLVLYWIVWYILRIDVMKAKEMYLGGWVTALVNLVAIGSAGGEEIQKGGFVLAMLVILAVSCGIRLMVASSAKDKDDSDTPTNWVLFGHYSLGAAISTGVTSFIFLL